jgi:CDP-diacylglycerol--glycerol-3-phosphate 3-phosphatidyltransferase
MLNNYREKLEDTFHVNSIVRFFINRGISPNTITVVGAIGTISSSIYCIVVKNAFVYAALLIGFFSSFDLIDGVVARSSNSVTRYGKVLDSFLDRVCDFVILFSLALNTLSNYFLTIAIGMALLCSYGVSYLRACGEAVGVNMKQKKVLFERGDRLITLVISLLAIGLGANKPFIIACAMATIISLSCVTIIQRLSFVYSSTKKREDCNEGLLS